MTQQLVQFLSRFNTTTYSRTIEFIYIGNEQSEEELAHYLEKELGESVGGYHYAFNDEAA